MLRKNESFSIFNKLIKKAVKPYPVATSSFSGLPVQLGDYFWSDNTCQQRCACTQSGLQCHYQPCSFTNICQATAFQYACLSVQRRTCTIAGDPHYYTFDGQLFHFQGTCTYVLSQNCGSGLPHYRVEGKNENRGSSRVSWTRLVRVFVHDMEIELVKGHSAQAKVSTALPESLCITSEPKCCVNYSL